MKGKSPTAVITNGDVVMRNAIRKVFPEAHHCLCSWHLLPNATANVGIPGFVKELEKCMFPNVEVAKFCRRWTNMVTKFQLEENNKMNDLLEKKHMGATTYITGQFFVGLRTTSRCKSLHGQLGKFIKSRYNLAEFVQHFQHCLCYMRYKEEEDDFAWSQRYGTFTLLRGTKVAGKNGLCLCIHHQKNSNVLASVWSHMGCHAPTLEWITSEIQRLKDKYGENLFQQLDDVVEMDGNLQDPIRVRTKGCGRSNNSVSIKGRRKNKCSQCGGVGHKKNVVLNYVPQGVLVAHLQ
ncbi:MULE transposase domain [Sesbania bispinosa]|nr:MULE transposase domain [Sesbania bispinosa]